MDSTAAPQPDLSAHREQALALATAPTATSRQPVVRAKTPLRDLPPAVTAQLAAWDQPGVDRPAGRGGWQRVVIPGAVLVAVDAVALVLAAANGQVLLAVIAGVLLVLFALIVFGGVRYRPRGPAPLGPAEQRAIDDACCWRSPHDWSGSLAGTPALGLVVVAADAAKRIADDPTYVGLPSRPDLGASLDEIDDLAHRVGVARLRPGADDSADPEVEATWDAALERVAAMIAYADMLGEQT